MVSAIERNALLGEYLAQAARGSEEAFTRFYDETSPLAYGLALKLLGNAADAEDIALDAYVQVWRSAAQYQAGRSSALTWLLMIVRTRAVDRLRARKPPSAGEEALAAISTAHECSPARRLEEKERAHIVAMAMAKLPGSVRRVMELAYFRGLTHSEIAADTGEPLGTVKSRIRRGLQILRESLAKTPVAIAIP